LPHLLIDLSGEVYRLPLLPSQDTDPGDGFDWYAVLAAPPEAASLNSLWLIGATPEALVRFELDGFPVAPFEAGVFLLGRNGPAWNLRYAAAARRGEPLGEADLFVHDATLRRLVPVSGHEEEE
jgi:hypothetical protein